MMKDQVFAQALLVAGELTQTQRELLKVLSQAAASGLELRLKETVKPEDCGQDFVTAASLLAVAALGAAREDIQVEEFKAGDLSVRRSGGSGEMASQSLEKQAWLLMKPYLADSFSFVGV